MPSVDKSDDKDAASDDKAENIWGSILSEVQSGSQTKLTTSKSVVILGDNESGKTTLVSKLQGVEDQKKGSALEFMYVTVRDEYGDDQSRLSVWLVDGDVYCRGLLKFALTEQNFAHSCVLLVASLTRPWDVLDSLTRWSDVLSTHVHRLKLAPHVRRQQEDAILRQFEDYVKPEDGARSTASATTSADSDGAAAAASSLGDNTLTVNLGIPIIVVLTKSDAVSSLEKDNDYRDEHFDFIQQHVRKFCLQFGAALFYTSAKENKNCPLLYKYLVHRLYGYQFLDAASVVEKESVFIPAGWDSEKKIAILYEGLNNVRPDDAYNDVITRPVTRKAVQHRETEVMCDEEQIFLMKLQAQLSKQPATPTAATQRESPIRMTGSAVPKSTISPRATVSAVGSAATPQKKPDSSKLNASTSDTGVLQTSSTVY